MCGTMSLFVKSTHLVHPCTHHHSGTPLENSDTPWGVRYARLTSTDLEQTLCGKRCYLFNCYIRFYCKQTIVLRNKPTITMSCVYLAVLAQWFPNLFEPLPKSR